MSESSAAETSNRTSGGAVVNEVKQNEQPISILNNRCTSTTRVTSVKSGNGSLRQIHQQQQQQPVLTGHSEGEDKTVAGSESLPSVEGVGERSFKPTPAKFDTGTTVRPAAAKAYINCSSVDPVNLELLEQKIKLITHGLDMSPDSSLMGSASSLNSPISFSKTPTGAVAAVSFTVPGNAEKISHRGSISTRPPNPSSKHTSSVTIGALGLATVGPTSSALVGGIQHAEAHHHDSDSSTDLSRQNSIVHMPGDFIYFEPPLHAPLTPMSPANPGSTSSLNKRHGHHISNKAIIGEDDGPQVPFTTYFQKEDDEKIHILIGATGSVATMKVPLIIDKLFKIYSPNKVSIQLVVTKRAEHFLKGLKINKEVKLWRDEDEWFGFKKPGDPVLHLELRKWADIFLVAPLSANTLAKVANGICDNLLTSLLRVWNPSIPVIVAPAMNTFMYTHPVTKKHLAMLLEGAPYIQVLKPVEKVLVCGDIGMGGMREWIEIVEILVKSISKSRSSQAAEKLGDGEDENDVNSEDDNDDEDDEDDDGRPSGEETDETDATDVSDPEAEDDEDDDEDGENPPYGQSTNPSAESRIGTGNSSQLPSYNPIMDGMVTAATLRSH